MFGKKQPPKLMPADLRRRFVEKLDALIGDYVGSVSARDLGDDLSRRAEAMKMHDAMFTPIK